MPAKKGEGKSKSKGKSGKPRGRKSWGGGEGGKLEFLLSFEQEYLGTADPGGLYTKMTVQFLEKYGYDLPFDTEPEEGFVPVIPNLADLPYDEQIAEQEKRDAIYMKLRLKIGGWLRHRFLRKQTDEDMVADLLRTMSQLTVERPRRRTAMNIYWADNYASKIRKEFQEYWKTAKLTAPPDSRMSMCADYVKSRYEEETDEYRYALEKRADTEYKHAMDEYNRRDTLDGTPEAYEHAWNEADDFLHIFVDAIAKKFGMSVSLLLTGPLGSEQGKVVMRSAHSNNVGAMTSLIWPEFDKLGFKAVQDSIVRYGKAVFSPEECKRRVPRNSSDLNEAGENGESTPSADVDDMSEVTGSYPEPHESMNLVDGAMNLVDGDMNPQPVEPMNLIAGVDAYQKPNDAMNFEMPVAFTQPQGEFTALLDSDWNWANTVNWGDTANQQHPLWNSSNAAAYAAPSHPPIFMHGPNVLMMPTSMPTTPRGTSTNPTLPVAAMTPVTSQTASTTPGAMYPTLPITPTIPAIPTSTPTTPGGPPLQPAVPAILPNNPVVPTMPIIPQSSTTIPAIPAPLPTIPQGLPLPPALATISQLTPAMHGHISTPASTPIIPEAGMPPTASATPQMVASAVNIPMAPSIPPIPASIPTTPTSSSPLGLVDSPMPSIPVAGLSTALSLSPAESTLLGKENELPSKKKRKRVEPADTQVQGRPHRTSKPPPHLKDGGYVPPSKGTRKQAPVKATKKKK